MIKTEREDLQEVLNHLSFLWKRKSLKQQTHWLRQFQLSMVEKLG